MKSRETLLDRLLRTLVEEWGQERVTVALANLPLSTATPVTPPASKKRGKLSATEQIERSALEGERRDALSQIAAKYDRKQFLPTVADVREFLVMMGERPVKVKDRQDAFRILLLSLTHLPVERLRQFAAAALHSGPSELGPLSDAITAAAEQLPRSRESVTEKSVTSTGPESVD